MDINLLFKLTASSMLVLAPGILCQYKFPRLYNYVIGGEIVLLILFALEIIWLT